jgi:hypothetical protein
MRCTISLSQMSARGCKHSRKKTATMATNDGTSSMNDDDLLRWAKCSAFPENTLMHTHDLVAACVLSASPAQLTRSSRVPECSCLAALLCLAYNAGVRQSRRHGDTSTRTQSTISSLLKLLSRNHQTQEEKGAKVGHSGVLIIYVCWARKSPRWPSVLNTCSAVRSVLCSRSSLPAGCLDILLAGCCVTLIESTELLLRCVLPCHLLAFHLFQYRYMSE